MLELVDLLLAFSSKLGYAGIVLLMTIESSFIPFPSELVIPPAAYLAQQGQMNIYLVVLFGILGSLIGATINYFLALTLGRKLVYALVKRPFARFLLLSEDKLLKSEKYFLDYGRSSTFFGRLIPAVRQLISIPAGFSKMSFPIFLFYTGLGAGIWTAILAAFGYWLGANQEILYDYLKYYKLTAILLVILACIAVLYIIWKKKKNKPVAIPEQLDK